MYKFCLATVLTGLFFGCNADSSSGTMTTTPAASCTDSIKNGSESDVDCGGTCGACANLKNCGGNSDCTSGFCKSGQCIAVSCSDGLRNGKETDLDCGGSDCPGCAVGAACRANADCGDALCIAGNKCYRAASCSEIHQLQPTLTDGLYSITGGDKTIKFPAYCDMTRDMGGWTLILKASAAATLTYDSPYWTDQNLLNETVVNLDVGDAKYKGFLTLPVTTLRGELVNEALFTKTFDGTMTASQIFNGGIQSASGLPGFQTNSANWSVQPNCQSFGVNMRYNPTSTNASRARMGYVANNDPNTCATSDTAIGLGVQYGFTPTSFGAGFICYVNCNKGNRSVGANGLLWVR